MQEFSPLVGVAGRIAGLNLVVLAIGCAVLLLVAASRGAVDELQDEGATGDDAGASRQEVAADNVLEYGGFTAGLRSNYGNLREVDGVLDTDGGEDILQLVDECNKAGVVDVDPAPSQSLPDMSCVGMCFLRIRVCLSHLGPLS